MTTFASTTDCAAMVLFGATGDLARRMLWPSLFALDHDGLLPSEFKIIGAAHSRLANDEFIGRVKASVLKSSNAALYDDERFARFAARIQYVPIDADTTGGLNALRETLASCVPGRVIYYLSTAPHLFIPICDNLRQSGLAKQGDRIVIEKPIGTDIATARATNDAIAAAFDESCVFRIDHYLGKETVQNLIALRFANAIFEPLWNSTAIEQVQITVAETVGVEGRWSYYDITGALRDMVQSHMLQLLCLVAMEPPAAFSPNAVRNEKVKVLWSLRPLNGAEVASHTVTGQYTTGYCDGKPAPGYREEIGANTTSDTETFIALRAEINNWRWAGVPFYMRTGKRMQARSSEIVIEFKTPPFNIFTGVGATLAPNVLLIKLQPEERITLSLMHKTPGLHHMQLGQVALNLSVEDAFATSRRRIAYERMLLDVLHGNTALFVGRDEVEAAWQWIEGITDAWTKAGQKPKPYAAGSWGPSAAIGLPERYGHSWHE